MTTDTAPDREGATLDGDLGWTLGVVFRAYVRASDHALADLPGGGRGLQVLRAAACNAHDVSPANGQGAIARRLGVDRTVMTYLVDDLEQAGLVARRPDPSDRRQRMLVATRKGAATLRRHLDQLAHVEEHVLAPLAPDERAALRVLLERLASRAEAQDPAPADQCTLAELVDRP